MIAIIAQCEMTVDKLHVVKQMNELEAKNYAKLHSGDLLIIIVIFYEMLLMI